MGGSSSRSEEQKELKENKQRDIPSIRAAVVNHDHRRIWGNQQATPLG